MIILITGAYIVLITLSGFVGRGAGIVISFAGAALVMVSVCIPFMKEIRKLEENRGDEK